MARVVFMKIEDGVRAADAFQRERPDQLILRKDLFTFRRRPAEQSQKISECGRHESAIAISRKRNDFAMLAFGKLCFVRGENQRQMRELRNLSAKRLIEQSLFMCVR